jgi:MFS transporter, OFA family, oxalate/formate antiporter
MASSYSIETPSARPRATVQWLAWTNVLIGAVAMVATLPGRTIGLGLITEPLLRDLGIGRVDFGLMNLWATLVGATFSLLFGPMVDRVGARAVLTLNLLLLGGSVHWMARAADSGSLALSLTLTRGLGQSALSVVSLALVAKGARRVDAAMAVFAATVAVGFIAAIPGMQYAVERSGWRTAWSGAGWALLAFACIAMPLVRNGAMRARSGDASPDTDVPTSAIEGSPAQEFTLRGALGTAAFWVLAVSCAAFNLLFSAVSLFCESILREKGIYAPATFRVAMGGLAAGGIAGNAAAAFLVRRLTLARLLSIGMLVVSVAMVALASARSPAVASGAAALLGIAGGVVTVVFFACWPRLFGKTRVGAVQGAAQVLTVLLSAAGPLLIAAGERHQGSYAATLLTMTPFFLLLAIACWVVRTPQESAN